ncbi:SDR family NAD(P)-dependent oxidoreductase [Actinomadura soli]|uniref:SDR family NAD(P)-dependent oxidoreductase n=1 Tax=Actinomadura soli TaxID=2508997 RepID=UPI00197AC206|nr:SDR family NAD(P)-dependent oxidoreductase [Actinomadura soli]
MVWLGVTKSAATWRTGRHQIEHLAAKLRGITTWNRLPLLVINSTRIPATRHHPSRGTSRASRKPGQLIAVRSEFGTDSDVDVLFAGLEAGLGGRPLDVLVNNAAIQDYDATTENATTAAFERVFAVNVRAPLFITQRALPMMRDGGRVINISSASHGSPSPRSCTP